MATVEPVPDAPAAVAEVPGGRALVVADYHAGVEVALRGEGVEAASRADERLSQLRALLTETSADRVVVLGDLAHDIGRPSGEEAAELEALVDALPVAVTLVPGNHDGGVGDDGPHVERTPMGGVRLGEVGFVHGHTWPAREVLAADVVCMGHEHPAVRIEDAVGASRIERAWLRGPLDAAPFEDHYGEAIDVDAELIVFPAFNDLVGGTWVNVERQSFLAPFLPAALPDAEAYLLDGTRLGPYRRV
ncbi:MAG: metallophosphoesterase [Halobacteriaceae archaeon]